MKQHASACFSVALVAHRLHCTASCHPGDDHLCRTMDLECHIAKFQTCLAELFLEPSMASDRLVENLDWCVLVFCKYDSAEGHAADACD